METKELKKLLNHQTKDLREYVDGCLSNQTKVLHEDYARQVNFYWNNLSIVHQLSLNNIQI